MGSLVWDNDPLLRHKFSSQKTDYYSDATTEELNITGYIDLSKVKKLNLDVVKLDIGDAVTSIAKDAFIDCSTLQSVVF